MTSLPPETLSTHEVCAATGATFRMIDYWTKQGYIIADERTKESSGMRRRYSRPETAVAQMMCVLIEAGVVPAVAARAGRALVLSRARRIALDEQVTVLVAFSAERPQVVF